MENKIIRRTPDQLGYHDRGKMKWQGLILSDMNELLKKHNQSEQRKNPLAKKEMDIVEITKILKEAYLSKKLVKIQANILKEGQYYPDLICSILGYEGDKIYLQLRDRRVR
ncbi:MAG: hypothetical protein L0L39_04535, partial [Atopostipes suicloacalis]|nr:hypothetical protein [Atopostipes suicloacalis]